MIKLIELIYTRLYTYILHCKSAVKYDQLFLIHRLPHDILYT